eukprot:gene3670-4016_t
MIAPDPACDCVQFSSSLEIEAKASACVNMWGVIKDPVMRRQYHQFTADNETLSSILTTNLYISLFAIFFFVMALVDSLRLQRVVASIVAAAVVEVTIVLASWLIYYFAKRVVGQSRQQLREASSRFISRYHQALILVVEIALCFRLIFQVVQGPCSHSLAIFYEDCIPEGGLPMDRIALITMMPLLYAMTVRGAHFPFVALLWFLSSGTLVFAACYINMAQAILFALHGVECIGHLVEDFNAKIRASTASIATESEEVAELAVSDDEYSHATSKSTLTTECTNDDYNRYSWASFRAEAQSQKSQIVREGSNRTERLRAALSQQNETSPTSVSIETASQSLQNAGCALSEVKTESSILRAPRLLESLRVGLRE